MDAATTEKGAVPLGSMKEIYRGNSALSGVDLASMLEALEDQFEQVSFDGTSSRPSIDGLSSSEALSLSFGELPGGSCSFDHGHAGEDGSSCSTNGSSPLGWPLGCSTKIDKCQQQQHHYHQLPGATIPFVGAKTAYTNCTGVAAWEDKASSTESSEIEMMKEKFSKLLLGEDMSGGGKGVCSALAISNAITNLSASVFGELWRLEPLAIERKAMWKREMDWLLSVADHIVELVPSVQTFPDGSNIEVMVSRPRNDLHVNLPALRKLDAMLLESLESFKETEFWYVDQGIAVADEDGQNMMALQRQEEKWWLPTPKVPFNGLSTDGKKRLQHQRECLSQILKAAVAINSQILSEMEIPDVYWNALPKSGKASLGEAIYRNITSEYFSAEALLSFLDLSTEHKAVDVANHLEAAVHVWRRRRQLRNAQTSSKDLRHSSKNSWGIVKDLVSDVDRREFLAGRAESLLLCLKQKFPSLRQSILDMTKIQYNKDVGQSILESYSRVLESLAFNIIARIDDVMHVDDITRRALPPPPPAVKTHTSSAKRRGFSLNLSVHTPYATPHGSPSASPTPSPSPRRTPNSPYYYGQNPQVLSDYIGFSYEFENDGSIGAPSGKPAVPIGVQQQSKTTRTSSNSIMRAQMIHPVQD